jgi:hypothetical protein
MSFIKGTEISIQMTAILQIIYILVNKFFKKIGVWCINSVGCSLKFPLLTFIVKTFSTEIVSS